MSKVLVCSYHGLGDNILLTAVLRKYKELNPESEITLAGLKRFENSLPQLLSGLDFIKEVKCILPDVWNDFDDIKSGVQAVIDISNNMEGFDKKFVPYCARIDGEDIYLHKILRFAKELGVEIDNLEDLQTEIKVKDEYKKKVSDFLGNYTNPLVVIHNKAGNTPKEFIEDEMSNVLKNLPASATVFEFGRKSFNKSQIIEENDMEFTKALVDKADIIVAIDSVILNMANALRKNIIALFKYTPVHQVMLPQRDAIIIGIDNNVTCISKWKEYKNRLIETFSTKKSYGRVIITGAGHSGGNWLTEIARQSGEFEFTDVVDDRSLFYKKNLPNGYGTKLTTDDVNMTPFLLDRLLNRYDDMKVLFSVRHPFDNCLSKIYRGMPDFEDNEPSVSDRLFYSWDATLNGCVKSMEASYEMLQFLKTKYDDRLLVVKLEDLIENREAQVDRICKFLGVEKNDKMINAFKHTRNRHHKGRYNNELDKTQSNLRDNLDNIYNGFFKNRGKIVEFVNNNTKWMLDGFGYTMNVISPTIYDPMCYWAHMLTFRCDGNCPYCIVDGRGKHVRRNEMSGKEIVDWWNSLEHQRGQRLSLIGGEPTLHKDIVEIVNNLQGYNITITTNCVGKFYEDEDFHKKFKPHPTSILRINTSYHPHAIRPEEYIRIIKLYESAGHHVDQKAFVYTPEVMSKYKDEIETVKKEIPLKSPPFLGFYNDKDGFDAECKPEYLEPNEKYWDQEGAKVLCGINDYDFYRKMCGQEEGSNVKCNHALLALMLDPEGTLFSCHYKMYYNLDPICNINNIRFLRDSDLKCDHFGKCNWCDLPRFYYAHSNLFLNRHFKNE